MLKTKQKMLLSHSHESSGRLTFKRVEQFASLDVLSFTALGVCSKYVHQCKKQVFATILIYLHRASPFSQSNHAGIRA